MASLSKRKCTFFARGLCRNGDSCNFLHEQNTSTESRAGGNAPTLSTVQGSSLTPPRTICLRGRTSSTPVCTFFVRGWCSRGDQCSFTHPSTTTLHEQADSYVTSQSISGQRLESSSQVIPDSRAATPCRFFASSGGCRNGSCPYLHASHDHNIGMASGQEFEIIDNEDREHDDDFTRKLSGALVSFDEVGHVLKVSLPADFSLACITGIDPGTTFETLADILRGYGYEVDTDCIRNSGHSTSSEMKVVVKVENPLFAQELSAKLKEENSNLSAVSLPVDDRRSNCRKVHASWHKATRTAWLNFGNGVIASRVAQKFNDNTYSVLGQSVKSSAGKHSGGSSYNPVAWTIALSDIPGNATVEDIEAAIESRIDRPRHVELGSASHHASGPEVSAEVRSLLEDYGRLESFYLPPTSKGKRVKVVALFQEEADAQSACSLNNRSLPTLKGGKLTVTLIQSAKVKVQTVFYQALKSRIEREAKPWKEEHVMIRTYSSPSHPYTTVKIESDNIKGLARARKQLDEISSGIVIREGEDAVWTAAFNTNGNTYEKLKQIEKDLEVVIHRNKSKHQLRFYGPPEKFQQATVRIAELLQGESSAGYEIDLNPDQFSWMIRGGFKSVQQALGKNVAVLNVVSKKITIGGTRPQYETALAIVRNRTTEPTVVPDDCSLPESDCPICFCEAESPLQTSCKHIYCLGCFEDYCRSAASTGRSQFPVKCQGDGGTCSIVFTLQNLKEWLSSSVFETVLQSSFDDHIQRHPNTFRYCPTPDCGYIYRCPPDTSSKRLTHSCPNCLEPICTSCHARHGGYTCAEYKDIASGGYEALKKLKRELNVKDCPRCTTPMEKTEGCNHMTCPGCKVHICWVCMALFEASGPCYAHMTKEHGGCGLNPQAWMR